MAVYVVTGKLGAGKTLVAVGKIKDKLVQGCKVATNLDINLDQLIGPNAKQTRFYRIPDKPTLPDLQAIGTGTDSYDENKNGLLVLDECGTWFNSRSWADKSRQDVINWFLHARKLGWDIIFLIQDLSIMDKQARVSLAEHVVYCRRLDRVTLPFVGSFYKFLTGSKMPLPKLHMGIVKYGDSQNALIVDRWTYTGRNLYSSYNTKQAFSDSYPHNTFSQLPPWLTHGYFRVPRDGVFYMRMTKIYWRRFNRSLLALGAFVSGIFLTTSVLVVDRVNANTGDAVSTDVQPLDLSRFETAHIAGYARLGDMVTYRIVDAADVELSTSDIRALGYRVVADSACSVSIVSGADHVQVTC